MRDSISTPIYSAPPDSGTAILGKTLPQLMYEAQQTYRNPRALNQPTPDGAWDPTSLRDFVRQSEALALGLRNLGLESGDRVALFMESDVPFCIADMGCLMARLVDVPIYLTHTDDAIAYVMNHAEVRALVVSSIGHLQQIAPVLSQVPTLEHVLVAGPRRDLLPELDLDGVTVQRLHAVQAEGMAHLRADRTPLDELVGSIRPDDLATIIYTSGTTGMPKGVMLSHENISFNAMTAFSGMKGYEKGKEITLAFLPMTHVFARALHYGNLANGTSVYFSTPDTLGEDLKKVRPTVFATVPRVLEKVYSRILEKATLLTGLKKRLLNWALDLAEEYELGTEPSGAYAAQLAIADKLVFTKWRDALGGRVRFVICGGAALSAKLANLYAAAGVNVQQGYGLTETSPVITYNRPHMNRAGTVGVPMPGVEVRIARDGEILTRGPHVMMGYYKDAERTQDVLTDDGWFHTGDIGTFTPEGYLRITDRKKALFKLSTGKYVIPQPLENTLTTHPLVEQAVVVGSGYKYCTALIFPEQDTLRVYATSKGIDASLPMDALTAHPLIIQRYQELVSEANHGMAHWSTIKRFRLVPEHLTPENGLLTPTMKVRRSRVREAYQDLIDELYNEGTSAPKPVPNG